MIYNITNTDFEFYRDSMDLRLTLELQEVVEDKGLL